MERPHPHTNVTEDRHVTHRVTQWRASLLLAQRPQSNNDDITVLMGTHLTLESITTSVSPNLHYLIQIGA